jgi:hypothetical protein
MTKLQDALLTELEHLLDGGNAHVSFKDAIHRLPAEDRGKVVGDLPYSIWQIVEHIRIAQWDMVKFSQDATHESPEWPDGYWPKAPEPPSDSAWRKSIKQIESDLEEFKALLHSGADIAKPIPHGDGQSILREALQIADHNAYHIAEIVVIRRLLGCWK